jgi:hypothetical protein
MTNVLCIRATVFENCLQETTGKIQQYLITTIRITHIIDFLNNVYLHGNF